MTIVEKLISEIRLEAGSSGMVTILTLLKDLPVYDVETEVGVGEGKGLPSPMPMAFADAWIELFDVLLVEANKSRSV